MLKVLETAKLQPSLSNEMVGELISVFLLLEFTGDR